MRRFLRFCGLLAITLALSACSTVMYVKNPRTRTYTEPVYASSKPYFFFGLIGKEQEIYLEDICLGRDIDQIAAEYTGKDVAWGILTLGIYTPRTLQIWCQL